MWYGRPLLFVAALVLLCTLTALRIVATHRILSPTGDEHVHIATGGEYIRKGKYTWDSEHPPLARVAFALSLAMLGTERDDPFPPRQGRVGTWTDQENKDLVPRGNYMVSVAHARLGNLLFVVLAIVGVALLGSTLLGPFQGFVAAALFALLPTTLAHGALCTTDMAGTAALPWALLSLHRWLADTTWSRSVEFGVIGGLCLVTKFSFLFYFGLCAAILIVARRRFPFRKGVAAFFIASLVVWAVYLFDHGRMVRMNPEAPALTKKYFGARWIGEAVNIPAPRFLFGLIAVKEHDARGHPTYLLGEVGQTGWWYYFPVLLAVKTPIPLLALAGAGAWLMIRRRMHPEIPVMVASMLVGAMTSHLNLGVRHVLPIYVLLAILAAHAGVVLSGRARIPVFALGVWLVVGSFLAHPDYLPWMNAFAGGRPERVAVESNFDWGQDVLRLAGECRKLGQSSLGYFVFGNVDADRIGLPPTHPIDPYVRSSGWIAVSEGALVVAQVRDPVAYAWLTESVHYRRVGRTIRLYRVE